MHIGAELHLPTDDARRTHTVDEPQPKAARDPFDGLPLKAWAERLGERVMPAYEAVKEEQQRMKRSAKKAVEVSLPVPKIPHLLPFTRWCASCCSCILVV